MKLIADTHTHSLACDHAYSTVAENIRVAAQKGLRFLCITEHSPSMPGAPTPFYFHNLHSIPPIVEDVILLKGAEVNIMEGGNLDLPDHVLAALDWVIASFHMPNFAPQTAAEHTRIWHKIAEDPNVDVIGHCGDSRFPFDEQSVLRAFARYGKIVEINAHSFAARPGSEENCPRIVRLCAEEGVRVVVSSDAHYCDDVGKFAPAVALLERMQFPEELILNADYARFLCVAKEKAQRSTKTYLKTQ